MTTELWIDVSKLDALPELLRKMLAGRHIGRLNDSALWASLEANSEIYIDQFAAMGYDLCIDQRGFAWLQNPREDQAPSKPVRLIAIVLLLVFERQAAAGTSLDEFERWHIDGDMLRQMLLEQRDLLETLEIVALEGLEKVLKSAVTYGFARKEGDAWRLLPATRRFTDHFERLAAASDLSLESAPEAIE